MKSYKMAGLTALLAIVLLGSACTPQAEPTPTVDPNLLYTAAAQTVVAQLTQNAPPPTATLAPTATQAPTMAALPTLPPLTTLGPLKTATMALGASDDKCQYITQSPADYTSVKGGSTFNIIWRIKNTGTTTWDSNYQYRFYAAVNKLKTGANGYNLTSTVLPNGEVELKTTATAGNEAGQYDAQWVLTNPQGRNFCAFSMVVNVTAAPGGSSGGEATKAPTEAEIITYDEDALNVIFAGTDHAVVNHTDGEPIQARVVFRTEPGYTGNITATGNNGVSDSASMTSTSAGTGILYFGITHGAAYNFTIDLDTAGQRVYRVEVCVSSVNCW